MLEQHISPPVMLQGLGSIAKALGVSPGKVRKSFLICHDFPAKKDGPTGSWYTTLDALTEWANDYVRPRRQ
jgi:hypothetical protein